MNREPGTTGAIKDRRQWAVIGVILVVCPVVFPPIAPLAWLLAIPCIAYAVGSFR